LISVLGDISSLGSDEVSQVKSAPDDISLNPVLPESSAEMDEEMLSLPVSMLDGISLISSKSSNPEKTLLKFKKLYKAITKSDVNEMKMLSGMSGKQTNKVSKENSRNGLCYK